VDSTFYELVETKAGGSGPPEPPETYPPCTNPPSPRPSINILANMEAKRHWLATDSIVVPSAQHPLPKHPDKLLSKFDPDNDVTPEDHIKPFMLSLRLMDVQHEYVVCRLFPYTFVGKASTWFFSLTTGSIASSQQFENDFLSQFRDVKTSRVLFLEISRIKINKKENLKEFNQRFINICNKIPDNPTESIQVEFYIVALPPPIAMFVKAKEKITLEFFFIKDVKAEKYLYTLNSRSKSRSFLE
jgi:hypothetical protein